MRLPFQAIADSTINRCNHILLLLLPILMFASSAEALLRLDFEQQYFKHQDRQVWDFSIVRPDSVYHIFYHTIHEATPHASYGDTIWHSTSKDLKHWTVEGPIMTSGQGAWDAGAVWAPDVFFDQVSGLWKIAYTGCDTRMNQRICMAESADLYQWTKSGANPVLEVDSDTYNWDGEQWWSNFRDPFMFRENDQWHILVTAQQWQAQNTGVIYHGISDDLLNWSDAGVFFSNTGDEAWRVLESPQYKVVDNNHYLFFGEYDTGGLSVISSRTAQTWDMANRVIFDNGYAPEIDEFDPGHHIISRLANFENPQTEVMSYVVRLDTMQFNADGSVEVIRPDPLDYNWASWGGLSCTANPTFGDNPILRGEESVGMVGNSYFGSSEYYQGPLSQHGVPGLQIGDAARGYLNSYPFIATGDRVELLVGGGNFPESCYVALVNATTDEILLRETGNNQNLMSLRTWDLRPYRGMALYISIVDDEVAEMGHINVDEIIEIVDPLSSVGNPNLRQFLTDHHASPNPFNPTTSIRFAMNRDLKVQVRIYDIRGHEIWSSGSIPASTGENSVIWRGLDLQGQKAPTGTYLYSIESQGSIAASGKLSLIK